MSGMRYVLSLQSLAVRSNSMHYAETAIDSVGALSELGPFRRHACQSGISGCQ